VICQVSDAWQINNGISRHSFSFKEHFPAHSCPAVLQGGCRAELRGARSTGGLIQGSGRIFTGSGQNDHWTDVHGEAAKVRTEVQVRDPRRLSIGTIWPFPYVRWLTDKSGIFCYIELFKFKLLAGVP
jgi:hypothetical protein